MELLLTLRETDKTCKKVYLKNIKYIFSVKIDLKWYKNDFSLKNVKRLSNKRALPYLNINLKTSNFACCFKMNPSIKLSLSNYKLFLTTRPTTHFHVPDVFTTSSYQFFLARLMVAMYICMSCIIRIVYHKKRIYSACSSSVKVCLVSLLHKSNSRLARPLRFCPLQDFLDSSKTVADIGGRPWVPYSASMQDLLPNIQINPSGFFS